MTDIKVNEVQNFFGLQDESEDTFDFDYQNKFLKVFIEDKEFSEQILDIVDTTFFDSYQKMLLKHIMSYVEKYGFNYDYGDLSLYVKDCDGGQTSEQILSIIDAVKGLNINRSRIKDRASDFFKKQALKNALVTSITQWKKSDYGAIANTISEALKKGEPKGVGHNYTKDAEKRLIKNYRSPVPILDGLNWYFEGGLSAGELGIIMAPTGGGKSMMLVKFACTALLAGKKVLYYTLELSEKSVGHRFDASLNRIQLKDVFDFPQLIIENAQRIDKLGGELIIQEYRAHKATVHTLEANLKMLERNTGFVPDVIFIDYADLLKSTEKFENKRDSLTYIYESIRNLAVETGVPVWTASQTNKGGINVKEFNIDVMGESMGKANTADVVIGVGRTNEDKQANPPTATISIIKNRTGQDGFYLPAIFDTRYVRIEVIKPFNGGSAKPSPTPQNGGGIHERTYNVEGGEAASEGISKLLEEKRKQMENN